MNAMRWLAGSAGVAVIAAVVLCGCSGCGDRETGRAPDYSDKEELDDFNALANQLQLKFDKIEKLGAVNGWIRSNAFAEACAYDCVTAERREKLGRHQ